MRGFLLLCSLVLWGCADNGTDPVTTTRTTAPAQESPSPDPPDQSDRKTDRTPNAGNVTISQPTDGSVVRENPLRIEGTARTFENNVVLEVLNDSGDLILQTATTATGDLGEFNPWATELWLTEWPGESLTVRAIEHSMKDGSIRSLATVELQNRLEQREITLFFPNARRSPNDCAIVYPVKHIVPGSVGMARLLVEAVIGGPTLFEQAQGFTSEFPRGAGVRSVELDGSTLTVDLSWEMQNVGGSCRVQAIRSSIETTLIQLPNVDRVRITAGGSEELALQP